MNSTFDLTNRKYQLTLDDISTPWVSPLGKKTRLQEKTKITTIALRVVEKMLPQVLQAMPSPLSQKLGLRYFECLGFVYTSHYHIKKIQSGSLLEKISAGIQLIACIAGIVRVVYSGGLVCSLTIQGLLLIGSFIGISSSLKMGFLDLKNSYQSHQSINERIACFVAGIFSISLAGVQLHSTYQRTLQSINGIKILQSLSTEQRDFVIKNHAIYALSQIKEGAKRAVIIDGMSSKWGRFPDDFPNPAAEFIYGYYSTRSYHVASAEEFDQSLQAATRELGGSIDLVLISGHASNTHQTLGKDYYLTGSGREIDSLNHYLTSNAQVILEGCNTATISNDVSVPLAQEMAKNIDREVTGFKALISPMWLSFSYTNEGGLKMESHYPSWHGFFNAVVTRGQDKGQEVGHETT